MTARLRSRRSPPRRPVMPSLVERKAAIIRACRNEAQWWDFVERAQETWRRFVSRPAVTAAEFIALVEKTQTAYAQLKLTTSSGVNLHRYFLQIIQNCTMPVAELIRLCAWGSTLDRTSEWWDGQRLDAYYIVTMRNLTSAEIDQLRPYCYRVEIAEQVVQEMFLGDVPADPHVWQAIRTGLFQVGLQCHNVVSDDDDDSSEDSDHFT